MSQPPDPPPQEGTTGTEERLIAAVERFAEHSSDIRNILVAKDQRSEERWSQSVETMQHLAVHCEVSLRKKSIVSRAVDAFGELATIFQEKPHGALLALLVLAAFIALWGVFGGDVPALIRAALSGL